MNTEPQDVNFDSCPEPPLMDFVASVDGLYNPPALTVYDEYGIAIIIIEQVFDTDGCLIGARRNW